MILVSDQNALAAAEWCQNCLQSSSWNVSTRWPSPGVIFDISDQQMATLFRLKWI